MAINRIEIEKFFENAREIRNLSLNNISTIEEEKINIKSLKPKRVGIFLANYYAENINKKFQDDLLK